MCNEDFTVKGSFSFFLCCTSSKTVKPAPSKSNPNLMELRKTIHKPNKAAGGSKWNQCSRRGPCHALLGSKRPWLHQKQLDRQRGCCTYKPNYRPGALGTTNTLPLPTTRVSDSHSFVALLTDSVSPPFPASRSEDFHLWAPHGSSHHLDPPTL